MPQILFIIDSGPQRGLGHLMRSLSLAEELDKGNHLHIISNNDEKTNDLLEKTSFDYTLVDKMDSGSINPVFQISKSEIIVTDLRSPDPGLLNYLKDNCTLLASIDDFNLSTYPSHVIFNGNAFGLRMDYAKSAPDSKKYIGPEFLLLNGKYGKYNKKEKKFPEMAKKILISFGGNDKNDLTVLAVKALNGIEDISVKVTLPLFVKERTLSLIAGTEIAENIHFTDFIKDMPREIFKSDIIITGGGASLNEAVCVGTPCITIPQADYEVHNSQYLEEKGAVVNMGLGSDVNPEDLKKTFLSLVRDMKKRHNMGTISKRIIDGRGAKRVAETILNEFRDKVERYD